MPFIKLINEGKPLPEKYRFLLFEDKREVELVWNGKIREVCTAVLPSRVAQRSLVSHKQNKNSGTTRCRYIKKRC